MPSPLLLLPLILLLTGCYTLQQQEMQTLRVWLTDISILSLDIPDQKYQIRLRIQNPNVLPLPVRGLNIHLHINQIHLARGVSNQSIGLPALSEAVVEMEVTSRTLGLAEIVQSVQKPILGNLLYELEGRVAMANDIPPIPFAGSGYLGPNPMPKPEPREHPVYSE